MSRYESLFYYHKKNKVKNPLFIDSFRLEQIFGWIWEKNEEKCSWVYQVDRNK